MTDKPDGDGLNGNNRSRINSNALPNAKLASIGLILSVPYPGLAIVLWLMEKPLVDYLRQISGGNFYWHLFYKVSNFALFVLCVAMFAGVGVMAFASYRAIRDYLL